FFDSGDGQTTVTPLFSSGDWSAPWTIGVSSHYSWPIATARFADAGDRSEERRVGEACFASGDGQTTVKTLFSSGDWSAPWTIGVSSHYSWPSAMGRFAVGDVCSDGVCSVVVFFDSGDGQTTVTPLFSSGDWSAPWTIGVSSHYSWPIATARFADAGD